MHGDWSLACSDPGIGGGSVHWFAPFLIPDHHLELSPRNLSEARMSRCPAAGQRRARSDTASDDAAAEETSSRRRPRTLPADARAAESSPARATAAPSREASGEDSGAPPVPGRPRMFRAAILTVFVMVSCVRLATPQVLVPSRAPAMRSPTAPRSRIRSSRRSRRELRSCSRARRGRRSRLH